MWIRVNLILCSIDCTILKQQSFTDKKHNIKQNKKQNSYGIYLYNENCFIKNSQTASKYFQCKLKKEFPQRRVSLKNNSDERIESLEDAASQEKCENRQVSAGTFRFGARWILILTFFICLTKSESHDSITVKGFHNFRSPTLSYHIYIYSIIVHLHSSLYTGWSPAIVYFSHLYMKLLSSTSVPSENLKGLWSREELRPFFRRWCQARYYL